MTPIRTLIEEELPLIEVNAESKREKNLRDGNISTMHLWWARRPLAMSRAVVAASLIADPGEENRFEALRAIAEAAPLEAATSTKIDAIRDLVRTHWKQRAPRVLDCFAGGGAIPLEALRLGCDVTSTDINPVAHILQLCVLDYPGRFGDVDDLGTYRLVQEVNEWGRWVHDQAAQRLSVVFPRRDGVPPLLHFWARTVPCADPSCGISIPMIKSRKLQDSAGRQVRVDFVLEDGAVTLRPAEGRPTDGSDWSKGTVKVAGSSVSVTCPRCHTTRPDRELRAHIRENGFGHYLYAVVRSVGGVRQYQVPTEADLEAAASARALLDEQDAFPEGTSAIPDESLTASQYRIIRPLSYGLTTYRELFTERQLLVLSTLCRLVREAEVQMRASGMDPERARAVATYLGLAVDRVADRNSAVCSWDASEIKIRNTFPQQSIRMSLDYVEVNPLEDVSGSWSTGMKLIGKALGHCCRSYESPARVLRANAQELPFSDGEFDAVIIDPPYYDAFQYGDLSDFFYVWLKRSIGHLYPELFFTPLTPKRAEVIENRADRKSQDYITHDEFERRLQQALSEVARVVADDGLVALVFAHTNVEAWERLLVALRGAGLVVNTSWPMRSELANRANAQKNAVLGSSVVLICRKVEAGRTGFYDDVVRELDQRIEERLAVFEDMQLVGADYFISAIGPAFDVFARYERVERLSGEEVTVEQLIVLARRAVARHAMRRLLGGNTLAALDDRSLFYLTWRWAYDGLPIPADEAYMLCRAFDVELDQLARTDGLVKKEGSGSDLKYRLVGPADRPRIELGVSPSLVDIMHLACRLHADGRRNELVELLGSTGAGNEPGFWAMVSAITEALPDGSKERTMLLGLGGGREGLTEASAKHTGPAEALTFDLDS